MFSSTDTTIPQVAGNYKKGITGLNLETRTSGDGYWSSEQRDVGITRLDVFNLFYRDGFRAELRAYFKKKDWNVDKHGLIYTDTAWIQFFKDQLLSIGFSKESLDKVDYSEQGMQGSDYVSMDVGDDFVREFAVLCCFGNVFDKHGFLR